MSANVIPFVRKPEPVDLDAAAAALLEALARSRGTDANVVADNFLKAHAELRRADILATCALAEAVVARFARVLLDQADDGGGAA